MLWQIRSNGIRHFIRGRCRIRRNWHRTKCEHSLNHGIFIKRDICHGKPCRNRRMCMQNCADILTFLIASEMHPHFRRRTITVHGFNNLYARSFPGLPYFLTRLSVLPKMYHPKVLPTHFHHLTQPIPAATSYGIHHRSVP